MKIRSVSFTWASWMARQNIDELKKGVFWNCYLSSGKRHKLKKYVENSNFLLFDFYFPKIESQQREKEKRRKEGKGDKEGSVASMNKFATSQAREGGGEDEVW